MEYADSSKNQYFNKIPPNDNDAEQAVLYCILFDKDALVLAYETLTSEDFYRPSNKAIFECIIELFSQNIAVDLITLKSKLDEKGITAQVGGIEYLSNLTNMFSTSANIKHYIQIVKNKSILRKLIKTSSDICSSCFEAKEDIDIIIENAEKNIFNILQNRKTEQFFHIHDVLISTIENIENMYNKKTKITGISTGFLDLDDKTAGLHASDLILIAARPSMGKTAFALNIAQNVAIRQKKTTAIFSLEMSKEQLVNRLICSEALLDAQKIRTGNLSNEDWSKLALTVGPLSESPLYIDDTPGITIMELRAKCRKLKLEKGLDLIVIDYLQLMSGNGRNESRQQEISEISRSLKSIAREMQAPVIALSQLSRACESRHDKRPILSDLRESGAIEQDADVVSFLYRDEYYNPDTDKKNQAEIIIAKQRNGPTGTINLVWLGTHTKFVNMLNHSNSNF